MGVYIKGIDKETFELIVGSVIKFPKGVIEVQEPHGRLIDERNVLKKAEQSFRNAGLHGEDYFKFKKWLTHENAVIEAEGERWNINILHQKTHRYF